MNACPPIAFQLWCRLRPVTLFAIALLLLPACTERTDTEGEANTEDTATTQQGRTSSDSSQDSSIVQIIAQHERFSTLATAFDSAGLIERLRSSGPYTVFAPTNDAFDDLPEGALDELLLSGSRDRLAAILNYHIVEGENDADELQRRSSITTLDGANLEITRQGDRVVLDPDDGNSATILETDIPASNGIIHVVDAVLMPPAQDQE